MKLKRIKQPTLLRRTPLQERQRTEALKQRILALLLPAALFYLGYCVYGLWPAGNKHLLAYDMYHQYAPFLLELRRKILSGDGLFFSWNGGLGVNFYSFFTYYSASPLNLLTILYPAEYIAEAITMITLLKLGLAGLFFRDFLSGAFRRDDPLSPLFSTFYALSAWVYAYSWNIMWLDTLVFLPVAAYGLVQIIKERRPARFLVGTVFILITNYYTGFFACAFLFLLFFVFTVQFSPNKKRPLYGLTSFTIFIGISILAALIAGVVLWPTAKALAITSAAGDAFPKGFTFTQPALSTLLRLTPLRKPEIMSGLPNIYSGILTILLLPAFFIKTKRALKVRAAYGMLLAFLFLSMQSRTLSFLWHGAHYPNSLDFRYAFVFVFLVITMAYQAAGDALKTKWPLLGATVAVILILLLSEQAWDVDNTLSHWRLIAMTVFGIAYLVALRHYEPFEDATSKQQKLTKGVHYVRQRSKGSERHQKWSMLRRGDNNAKKDKEDRRSLRAKREPKNLLHRGRAWVSRYSSRITFIHFPAMNCDERRAKTAHRNAALALFFLVVFELLFHGFTNAALYQEVAPLGDRQYYLANDAAREVSAYVKQLRADHAGKHWRCEMLPDTCVNDPMLFGYPGFSLFSSPFPKSSIAFFEDLGYPVNGVNSFQYKESTIVMDSLLSIDHQIVRNDRIFDDRIRQEVASGKTMKLLKNPDALPFGYFVSRETMVLNMEEMPVDALDVQNRLVASFGGNMNVLEKEAFDTWDFEGCYVERTDDPYSFRVIRDEGNDEWAFLVYDVPLDGQYYIFWEDESCRINYANGFIRDQEFFHLGTQKTGIGDMGFLQEGTQIHFRVRMPSDRRINGTFRAYIGRLNEMAWQETKQRLSLYPMRMEHFSSGSFSGQIEAPEEGCLFIPTTWNPGWHFKVDGVPVSFENIRGSFILLPLSAGEHTITARFIPDGFYAGLLMTLLGLFLTAALFLLPRLKKAIRAKKATYRGKIMT
ncbi:MAG: YfhO family protein [Clostridiaceae bacterium]|nr:YfhO family protein [Clostridiaceae bacterium]